VKALWVFPFLAMVSMGSLAYSQAIPVESAAGSQYATLNVLISKPFSPESRIGYFHQSTLAMDYQDRSKDDLTMQHLMFFELRKSIRLTGGTFYCSVPGFSPTVGVQYMREGNNWFVLCAPRVNIERDPSFTVFSIMRYKIALSENITFYSSVQALSTFDGNVHIKSYQWLRIGLEVRRIQFGLAANFDEFGPNPKVRFSPGLFVRFEVN